MPTFHIGGSDTNDPVIAVGDIDCGISKLAIGSHRSRGIGNIKKQEIHGSVEP